MKKLFVIILILVFAFSALGAAGCSFVKEGVTGERQTGADGEGDEEAPYVPAAFNITGGWFGVYNGSEYISFRFTADGKCELQSAIYQSDMFGPRYYGDYRWGGDGGDEIFLDMYQGLSREINYGDDNIWDEWYDGGRDAATTALMVSFRVFGGTMKSVALKAGAAGIDTDGYTVVQTGAFLVLLSESGPLSGNDSQFIFGGTPYDDTEGKTLLPKPPDAFTYSAERFYTTAELNVRCGPDTGFGTYGTVPPGTAVEKIAYMASGHDDWAFVLLMDGGGWVHKDYLADKPPAQEKDADDGDGGGDGGGDGSGDDNDE